MTGAWPQVQLGGLLRQVRRREPVAPDRTYSILGAHWYALGLYTKQVSTGAAIRASSLYRVRSGDFVYNRLFAWKGSFAVATDDNDVCYVSGEFPCFEISDSRLDPRFLWQYFRRASAWREALGLSTGSTPTSRNRLKEGKFLGMPIPLPPLSEQRRIVARIEELAAKIEEARKLKSYTRSESNGFWKVLSRMARANPWPVTELGEMVEFLDGRRIPLSKAERGGRSGPYPYYGASGIIDHMDDYIFDEQLLLLSEDGANLINRSTPIAFIADGKYWVNNHAHVLRPRAQVADIRFLQYAVSDYDVSVFNFASAQAKLNQANARKIAFGLPPLGEQRRIAAHLDGLQTKVDALKRLQAETATELDALLPSILDKAFKGEL